MISIHAPVKGATRFPFGVECKAQISIHAPVKGATHDLDNHRARGSISIHAPVKGATLDEYGRLQRRILDFNPRTREGCDGSTWTVA